ncbi:MAG: hypothetical protein ABR499_15815 [Gemmatimonadaceae bacterium]
MDPRDEFPEHDRAVRDWFAARGWPVTEAFAYFDPAIYAWRHRGSQDRHTLYVSKEVLDRNEARDLPGLLDQRSAEAALRELPDGEAILCYAHRLLVLRYFERSDN